MKYYNHKKEDMFEALGFDEEEEVKLEVWLKRCDKTSKSKIIEEIEQTDKFNLREKLTLAFLLGRSGSSISGGMIGVGSGSFSDLLKKLREDEDE